MTKRDKKMTAPHAPAPDAELEAWLRDIVVPRFDALKDGTAKLMSLEEARRLLLDKKTP